MTMKKLLCLCFCVLLLCGAMPVTTYAFTENYCDVFEDRARLLWLLIDCGGGFGKATMMEYARHLWQSEEYLFERNEICSVYHIPEDVLETAVKTYFYVEDMNDFKKPLSGERWSWDSRYNAEKKCYEIRQYDMMGGFGSAWQYYISGYVKECDVYIIYGFEACRTSEDELKDGDIQDYVYTGNVLLDGSKEIAVIEQYTKFVVSYDNGIVKFYSREIVDGIPDTVDMITPPPPGDTDGDGKVNVRDLGLLQQHLNGWDVDIHTSACDVNGDGKANVRDLGLLQQHLNGWDVELI